MEIPSSVKRRYKELENYLDSILIPRNLFYYPNIGRERYIHTACHGLSLSFVDSMRCYTPDNFNNAVIEHQKYMLYLFRTKLSINYEKLTQNGQEKICI